MDYRSCVEQYATDGTFTGWSDTEEDNYRLFRVVRAIDEFEINCGEYSAFLNGFGVIKFYDSDETDSLSPAKVRESKVEPLGEKAITAGGRHPFGYNAKEFTLVGNIHESPAMLPTYFY